MARREQRKQQDRDGRYHIVEDDQPGTALTVEQRAGDWRHDETREDRQEERQAGELGRMVSSQHEKDQRHGKHRGREAPEQHAAVEPGKSRDAQKLAVAGGSRGGLLRCLAAQPTATLDRRGLAAPLDGTRARRAFSSGSLRYCPVADAVFVESCSGVPSAMT